MNDTGSWIQSRNSDEIKRRVSENRNFGVLFRHESVYSAVSLYSSLSTLHSSFFLNPPPPLSLPLLKRMWLRDRDRMDEWNSIFNFGRSIRLFAAGISLLKHDSRFFFYYFCNMCGLLGPTQHCSPLGRCGWIIPNPSADIENDLISLFYVSTVHSLIQQRQQRREIDLYFVFASLGRRGMEECLRVDETAAIVHDTIPLSSIIRFNHVNWLAWSVLFVRFYYSLSSYIWPKTYRFYWPLWACCNLFISLLLAIRFHLWPSLECRQIERHIACSQIVKSQSNKILSKLIH